MSLTNPFPERGVATRETFYVPYWRKPNSRFNAFVVNLKENTNAQTTSQFLIVTGDLGSGKTATLYYMEKVIKDNPDINALVLFWHLSTPIRNQDVIQSFYNDFLNQLQKYLINNHQALDFIGTKLNEKIDNIINILDRQQQAELVDLLNDFHNIRMNLDPDNQQVLDEFRCKKDNIKSYLESAINIEIEAQDIQAMERVMIEGHSFLPLADLNISADKIKSNMQYILEEVRRKFNYDCIILLVDEFDILIRNKKGEIPESSLVLIRNFITWFSPEAFKGYHFVGALFSENLERLQEEEQTRVRIDSIYRRLLSQIILTPIPKFEKFYDQVFLPYLEKVAIRTDYGLFNMDYLRFIFHACKRNFGTIFSILHEQFTSWQGDINNSYQIFENDQTKDKTDISLYDLIWNERGLIKHFSKKFLEVISQSDRKRRKEIFTYLVRNKRIREAAPDYDRIKIDLGIVDIRTVSTFHDELASLEQFRTVFPYYEEHFYIVDKFCFRLFNLSGLGTITVGPIHPSSEGENEYIYFQTFMKKYSQKRYSDSPNMDWSMIVNDGFYFLVRDFLTNTPNPLDGFFEIRPLVNSYTLREFINENGPNSLLSEVDYFETQIQQNFHDSYKINILTIETKLDENTLDKIFLIVFLPLKRNYFTSIDPSFIDLFKKILENVNYKNKSVESIIIFSKFTADYNNLQTLIEESDSSMVWIHLIDRIIPISIELTTQISKDFDQTKFLSRRTPFTFFCAAFYKIHGFPEGVTKTYYELLFSPSTNEEAESNLVLLQNLLTHIFEEYQGMFKTYSHNQLDIEIKRRNSQEPPETDIQYFPSFIFNLSNLFNENFPISKTGKPFRQNLDLPFKIGNFDPKYVSECLSEFVKTSYNIPTSKKRGPKLTRILSVLSTLIEMNLITFSIDNAGTHFYLRNDSNSLFDAFEEIVKSNTVLNQAFDATELDLDCCDENSKGIDIIEKLLDFLVADSKIFRYYE